MGEGDETLGSEECKSGLSREETVGDNMFASEEKEV